MAIKNFARLNIVCVAFHLVFISYNSGALLAPQILLNMGYEGLGFYSVAVLYLVFGISSFFSTAMVNIIGTKKGFFFGSLTYVFWIFCFLAPCMAYMNPESDAFYT